MASNKKMALHWKILIGLLVGVVVGLAINVLWTDATWSSMGVNDPAAFLEDRAAGVTVPEDPRLVEAIRQRLDEITAAGDPIGLSTDSTILQIDKEELREKIRRMTESAAPEASSFLPDEQSTIAKLLGVLAGESVMASTAATTPPNPESKLLARADSWIVQAIEAIRDGQPVYAVDPNAEAGTLAAAARFVRHANGFIGDLFMRGLRFIAVPIVLFSLIVGISSLKDMSKLGRIGGKTIGIYLCTTAVAITLGLLFANLLGPGRGFDEELRESLAGAQAASAAERISSAEAKPSTWEVMLNIVPVNPFESLAETEMLQVVFAAVVIGIGLAMLPREKAQPVITFFDTMTEVVIKIVHGVLAIAPVAVFALIVQVLADLGVDVLVNLVKYVLTTVAGLAVMIFLVYPLVLRIFTPVRYGRFFWAISPAQLLAFSSSSSGATLPVTMECCEERLGASEEVTSFVVPIGATINMDGTALYQGVAAVFIAQMYGMDLTIVQQAQIVLTATLASIGTAAVPGVGIVMLVIVLQSVGIPLEGIAVILGVDRILDMCRTACNVTGDCMVCAVVASSENAMAPAGTAPVDTK